jgi:diguanylate cyclase (GGDEF)-like protein
VPVFANPNFLINLPTLCAVTGFITVISGTLLLFAWLQNRNEPALALWGVGYLIGTAGAVFLVHGEPGVLTWSICAGNALLSCAYGTMWAGARSFEGRRVPLSMVVAGAVIWIAACQIPGFYQSNEARVVLASVISATYSLLCAREMWYARDRELISRWPTLVLAVVHAGFLLARIHYAGAIRMLSDAHPPESVGLFVLAFEALFVAFTQAFLRMSMAKERAELQQRKSALTDLLTGIANRRAFFELGAPLLKRTIADRRPAALLLFDLDHFKEINDTAGHDAGDHVLRAFSRLVTRTVWPGALFARLGGEEFACLLPDAPMTAALQVAELVRGQFAAMKFSAVTASTTVSVGVAMAGEASRDLSALLAIADRALYRAKAAGRNRVTPAPLVLVEISGEGARQPFTIGGSAVIPAPAPLAG